MDLIHDRRTQSKATAGDFETGFWVDTIRGESRLHERLNTTFVKLAVPPATSALCARLRWSPPEGGQKSSPALPLSCARVE